MVRFPDRCAQASWNPLSLKQRRTFLKRLAESSQALFVLSSGLPIVARAADERALAGANTRAIAVDRASFFGLAQSGGVALACGERGLIARLESDSNQWKTQRLATQRSLTAIAMHTEGLAVVVGHSGVIFVSQDFGQQWQAVSDSLLKTVNPNREALLTVGIDANRRILVGGAFGVMASSSDLGKTWSPLQPLGDGFEWHVYHLSLDDTQRAWMLLGESGTVAESPNGAFWRELRTPYQGSFFGGLSTQMGARIIFGMRGRIYRQSRAGADWQLLEVPTTMAWMAGRVLKDGRIVLVGDQGMTAVSNDDGRRFSVQKTWDASLSDLIELPSGVLWISGKLGLKAFDSNLRALQGPPKAG
jgi:photosystem II stability/assembly factor-like uncharacterized protein